MSTQPELKTEYAFTARVAVSSPVTVGNGPEGLRRFIAICGQVTRESQELPPVIPFRDLDKAVAKYPTLFKYRNLTASAVLDECIGDPRLKSLLSSTWPHLGLPPDDLAFFSAEKLNELTARTFTRLQVGSEMTLARYTFSIGQLPTPDGSFMVPSPDGKVTLEIRLEAQDGWKGGRVTYSSTGEEIDIVMP